MSAPDAHGPVGFLVTAVVILPTCCTIRMSTGVHRIWGAGGTEASCRAPGRWQSGARLDTITKGAGTVCWERKTKGIFPGNLQVPTMLPGSGKEDGYVTGGHPRTTPRLVGGAYIRA